MDRPLFDLSNSQFSQSNSAIQKISKSNSVLTSFILEIEIVIGQNGFRNSQRVWIRHFDGSFFGFCHYVQGRRDVNILTLIMIYEFKKSNFNREFKLVSLARSMESNTRKCTLLRMAKMAKARCSIVFR